MGPLTNDFSSAIVRLSSGAPSSLRFTVKGPADALRRSQGVPEFSEVLNRHFSRVTFMGHDKWQMRYFNVFLLLLQYMNI